MLCVLEMKEYEPRFVAASKRCHRGQVLCFKVAVATACCTQIVAAAEFLRPFTEHI